MKYITSAVEFGERVSNLRRENNLSIQETARAAGIKVATYRMYERGQHMPQVPQLVGLTVAFGVTLDKLLEADDAS